MAHPDPPPDRPVGPCITSVLDLRDKKNPLEGFVVEDCAIPLAMGPFMLPMMTLLPDQIKPSYDAVRRATKAFAYLGSKYFGPYFPQGSVARTPTYLIMSHDSKYSPRQRCTSRKLMLILWFYRQPGQSHS